MARLDKIHSIVRTALEKDGWKVTHDPYKIEYKKLVLWADLGAEKMFAAERADKKIVVEVKSFIQASHVQDLKLALGQYDLYRVYLKLTAPERHLYLAVDDKVYVDFFQREDISVVIEELQLSLVIVNLKREEVVEWIR